MKKKGSFGLALLVIIFIGAGALYFMNKGNSEKEDFGVEIQADYAKPGEAIKIKISGAKKKKCTINWYVDENLVEDVNADSYMVTEDDLEKIIEVKVSFEDKECSDKIYVSKLPVLYFNTKSQIGNSYIEANLSMQGSETLKNKELYDGLAYIKLRGNSTRNRDKKPYKIELENKTDLLGLGSAKDFVLLAEDIDHTLIRNRLVMYFADELGLEYTSKATSVVLFVNNKYQGVYTLIEQVRIGESEVDITNYKDLAKKLARKLVIQYNADNGVIGTLEVSNPDTKEILRKYDLLEEADKLADELYQNLSWMSYPYDASYKRTTYDASKYVDIPKLNGGWLLEADFYSSKTDPGSVRTAFKQPFYFNTPEKGYTNQELFDYAKKYIQTFEYALHSDDFTYHEKDVHLKANSGKFDFVKGWITEEIPIEYSDKEHDGYRYDDLFDMESLINYFLVCEFTRNWDSMKNSVFLYKDVDKKACIGPVWDYDWGFGNINMYNINTNFPKGWQTTDYYFSNEQLYQNYNWNRYLIKDEKFVKALLKKYSEIRPTLIENIIRDGGILDTWQAELSEAGAANDARWRYSYRQYYSYGFDASFGDLRSFIEKRVAWLDQQFTDFDTLYESLNSYEQYEWK